MGNKHWTQKEEEMAKKMRNEGASIKEIAQKTGRTVQSVEQHLLKLGEKKRKKHRWTEKEREEARRRIKNGETTRQIAEATGWKVGSIRDIRRQLQETEGFVAREARAEEAKPWMTEEEIAGKVRRGVSPLILAQLNLMTVRKIKAIARKYGVEVKRENKRDYVDHGIRKEGSGQKEENSHQTQQFMRYTIYHEE